MAKAKAILKRKRSIVNTKRITRTMEMISAVKFRQSQNSVKGTATYRKKLEQIMGDLSHLSSNFKHPLVEKREVKKIAYIVLTSKRGLCGAFNANLVRHALTEIAADRAKGIEVEINVVGKKGMSYFKAAREKIHQTYHSVSEDPSYEDVTKIMVEFEKRYEDGEIDGFKISYQKLHSLSKQSPSTDVILPIEFLDETSEDEADGNSKLQKKIDYIFDPDPERVLTQILPLYVRIGIFSRFQEHLVGEHFARMVAMKNATENANEMTKMLSRAYNRARQTQITSEICDLMGGVEALK
ncbi:MAG: ATP synthase F1 subunit gamma [Planctomycetes bacterium]|nr:ATP synthase F1 subunit gamma [Planctomycetota bacterium]